MKTEYQKLMKTAAVTAGLLVVGRALAGSLSPSNTPVQTMHTLEEVYQKVSSVTGLAFVAKTGQTNSYREGGGDDGQLKMGVAWPEPRFTVQSDTNVVMDNLTGLIWARDVTLSGTQTWAQAIDYCNALSLGGYDDWRLPNVHELQSLLDLGNFHPSLPPGHPFINVPSAANFPVCWSSTSFVDGTNAWAVGLDRGSVVGGNAYPAYALPVRGGQ